MEYASFRLIPDINGTFVISVATTLPWMLLLPVIIWTWDKLLITRSDGGIEFIVRIDAFSEIQMFNYYWKGGGPIRPVLGRYTD